MASGSRTGAVEVAHELSAAPLDILGELIERYADDPRKQVIHAVEVARRRQARLKADHERVLGMYELMHELAGDGIVLGVDEVGRGAIAGPLVVGAVCLPSGEPIWGLDDSKRLSPQRREILSTEIRRRALAVGIGSVSNDEIDAVGMAVALRMAMRLAIEDTGLDADAVLIDGNPVHVHPREHTIVKGDARVACIAAASIVAKVWRDALMVDYSAEYPGYHLDECKGYASADHIAAIKAHGLTPIHRSSFCGNFLETPRLF